MNYITTTQLRTEASKLVTALRSGLAISLVHRSKVIGTISPQEKPAATIESVARLKTFLKKITPKAHLPANQRTGVYSRHLKHKYG